MEQLAPKLKSWASDLDPNASQQAQRTARLDVVDGVALMPDAHLGIGATVGSVIATKNAVIPAAVGVDIGCGMIACSTYLNAEDLPDSLDHLIPKLERAIPAGVGQGHTIADAAFRPLLDRATFSDDDKMVVRAGTQLGSLGSGNHFFELCLDGDNDVWIVLHSGSRGIGNKLAQKHIKLARAQQQGLEDPDLAYFLDSQPEFEAYVYDMLWAQDYARVNRELMMNAAVRVLEEDFGLTQGSLESYRINCHHNFCQREGDRWITRKGAIKADVTDLGVIPGSMGTQSYIIRGLGNEESYLSCSHGAGRRFSRGEAKRRFTAADLEAAMVGKAWQSDKAQSLIDEIPAAYKDIDRVMDDQKDLVEVLNVLRQILNYKGT
jgi:tRNA-splicing ligase RtcB